MKKNDYIFNDKVNKIWFIFLPIIWFLIYYSYFLVLYSTKSVYMGKTERLDFVLQQVVGFSDDIYRYYSIWGYVIFIVAFILVSIISSFIKGEIRLVFQIFFSYLIVLVSSIYTIVTFEYRFFVGSFVCILAIVFEIIACVLGILYAATKNKIFCYIMLPLNLVIAYGFNVAFTIRFVTMVSMIFFFVALLRSYEKPQTDSFNQTKKLNINVSHDYELPEVIRQYKELLDSGVITEEEYNEKKNELLH